MPFRIIVFSWRKRERSPRENPTNTLLYEMAQISHHTRVFTDRDMVNCKVYFSESSLNNMQYACVIFIDDFVNPSLKLM